MAKDVFVESARACIENGNRLLDDAEMLEFSEPPSTAFALAIIAQEEFAKGFLMALVARKVIPWHPLIYRASRDHTCKQLLGIVMEYLTSDFDEFLTRSEEWQRQHKESMDLLASVKDDLLNRELWQRINELRNSMDRLPPPVADALNILRHEKIGRWGSAFEWAEEPEYDPAAKMTADGSVDREKQDALYVRLSKSGRVVGTPTSVSPDTAKEARERAKRFGDLVESMIGGSPVGWDYEKLEKIMRLVFQDLEAKLAEPGTLQL